MTLQILTVNFKKAFLKMMCFASEEFFHNQGSETGYNSCRHVPKTDLNNLPCFLTVGGAQRPSVDQTETVNQ